RIHGEIAEIGSAVLGERIYVQHRIPGTDDRRLSTNVARAEAGPRAISGSAVERHTNQSNFKLFRLRNMRQAHERGNAGKSRIGQRVDGLGMGQLEIPPGWRHGWAS